MTKKKTSSQSFSPNVLQDALQRYAEVLSASDFSRLAACALMPAPPALRANTLKCNPPELARQLETRYGWQFEPVPFCPTGLRWRGGEGKLSETIEHRLGQYYIQDAASMLPPECFDFSNLASPLVLDMAASPGGKTTHLTARIRDQGLVIANDASRSRLPALRVVLQNWGALNQAVTCYPGEQIGYLFPGVFDAVLLDAPCSMEGLRVSPTHPARAITSGERAQLASRQTRLLEGALRAVKPGGQVVYSTCSLAPEEDEAVLDEVLTRFHTCFEIEPLPVTLPPGTDTLAEFAGRRFADPIRRAVRLWPYTCDTAGFFTALLRKTAPLPGESSPISQRRAGQNAYMPLKSKQTSLLHTAITGTFGIDLLSLMEEFDCVLVQRGAEIYLLPARLEGFPGLQLISAGMLLGKPLPNGWLVSHEFTSRFHTRAKIGKIILPAQYLPTWLAGQDAHGFAPGGVPTGSVVLVYDESGHYIGRGKAIANHLRNLLPARLF